MSRRRDRMYEVIFEADTLGGKLFDVALMLAILASVVVVMLDSVAEIRAEWRTELQILEWSFTILFTVEYALRLLSVRHPWRYARSFYGVVDLAAVLPTYVSLVLGGAQFTLVVRALRLVRMFRVLKLTQFVRQSRVLASALWAARHKITVFIVVVATIITVVASVMYLVEGPTSGFTSLPRSMYWAVVTMTTVGYGDIAPQTPIGQFLAAVVMFLGYAIIAVPTGIVSVELAQARREQAVRVCPHCMREGHEEDAAHCKYCGEKLV